jgi:hypothetical protein
MDPLHASLTPHVWNVPRQQDVTDARVVLLDHGDRLLWMLEKPYTPPLEALLQRFALKLQRRNGYRVSWCVSRIDGSRMREIACFDTTDPRAIDTTTASGSHEAAALVDVRTGT